MSKPHGLHPIEVTAHTVLSRPLDNLGDSLERLAESQLALLARLRLMQSSLAAYELAAHGPEAVSELKIDEISDRVKLLRKRIAATVKTLERVDARVTSLLEVACETEGSP